LRARTRDPAHLRFEGGESFGGVMLVDVDGEFEAAD
jgi:hypothetical protein